MTNAEFFSSFLARKTRRDKPRVAGSSAAARADRGVADGLGRRYLKAAPGRCPAWVRPEVGSFCYSARKKNKKKY